MENIYKTFLIKLGLNGPEILINNQVNINNFLSFENNQYTIITGMGGVDPIFLREYEGEFYISNLEFLLVFQNDKISIFGESLIANLCGDVNQNYTFFYQIQKLDCTSKYILNGCNLMKQSLFHKTTSTKSDIFKSLKASYQNLSNEKIILPISGGYDSRLSLGFLKDNVDLLIHQLNNEEDTKIVYELNDIVKKELVILNKKIDKEVTTSVSQRLIASSVRPTFFKWFNYLERYSSNYQIVGFGAEAHKGKYYDKIINIKQDSHRLFKLSDLKVQALKLQLGFNNIESVRHETIDQIINDAQLVYEEKSSIIDYIHYHLYVSHAYGKRNNAFSSILNVKLPTLNFEFLNKTFSLEKEIKEKAKLNKDFMQMISSELVNVDFHSGNASSFKPKGNLFFQKIKALKFLLRGNSRDSNFIISRNIGLPKNELTFKLLNLISSNNKFINRNSTIIVYNYLRDLEDLKDVEFSII